MSVDNDEKMKNKKENWKREKKEERKRKRSQGQQILQLKDIFFIVIFLKDFSNEH